jgi:hypothetical protein
MAVDIHLFWQVFGILWGDLTRHLERRAYPMLAEGVPQFMQAAEQISPQLALDDDQQAAIDFFSQAFGVVGAIAAANVVDDPAERRQLTEFARAEAARLDQASQGMLNLTELVQSHLK